MSDDTQRKRSNREYLGAKHDDGDRADQGIEIEGRLTLKFEDVIALKLMQRQR